MTRRIDTLAGEWEARSNYLYLTYASYEDEFEAGGGGERILLLGAGGFRIGVSVEFDWSLVEYLEEARRLGYDPVVLNFNPETVSTDWDVAGNLYFEEVSVETVLEVLRITGARGVVAFLAGQLGNSIARRLEEEGIPLIGPRGDSVDAAESKSRIHRALEELGVESPPWGEASTPREAVRLAEKLGLPVIVRPSYVIGGARVRVAYTPREVAEAAGEALRLSATGRVVVSKYIEGVEVDVDAVTDGRGMAVAVMEHVEEAEVHSGDSTMSIPWRTLGARELETAVRAAEAVAEASGARGLFNVQLVASAGRVYLIEVNLRASRSMPFASKATGFNMARAAAHATLGGGLGFEGVRILRPPGGLWAVKSPQFSWQRLKGAYPGLGPEMRSTGESAALGRSFHEALLASWLGVKGNRLPPPGSRVLLYTPTGRGARELLEAASALEGAGYEPVTLREHPLEGLPAVGAGEAVRLMKEGRVGLLATTGYTPRLDYTVRRAAADYNVPLVLNHRLALELAKAIASIDPSRLEPIPLNAVEARVTRP
jgi:carbamoyl-phosphate synthase large subunit